MEFLCVGGEHEGMMVTTSALEYPFLPSFDWEKGETYLRINAKGEGDFYMLAGMVPAAALKRWRELTGRAAPA